MTANSEVEFTCVAVATEIIFFVNGTTASESIIEDKGFTELDPDEVNDTTLRRSLTATALTQYNNTEIQCVA